MNQIELTAAFLYCCNQGGFNVGSTYSNYSKEEILNHWKSYLQIDCAQPDYWLAAAKNLLNISSSSGIKDYKADNSCAHLSKSYNVVTGKLLCWDCPKEFESV